MVGSKVCGSGKGCAGVAPMILRRCGAGSALGAAGRVALFCAATPLKLMGHRLSKIVTRTGDAGTTGLGDGTRTGKESARIAAIGDVDELNSTLGLLLVE